MKKFFTLMTIGTAALVLGMAAYGHGYDKPGAVLLFIGWLIISAIILIDMWKNTYLEKRRFFGIGWKIIAIGFSIFFLGGIFDVPGDMETLSNILGKVGLYIIYAGAFVCLLGFIEDRMHK